MIKHIHHIIPKHMGGSNHPSNLIKISVEEHAEAHRKLWEIHGKEEDRIAWLSLSKQMTMPELITARASLGGTKNTGKKHWFNTITNERKKSIEEPKGEGWINKKDPSILNRITEFHHDASGSFWCHDSVDPTMTKMVYNEEDIPSGWVKGRHLSNVKNTKGYEWYHNIVTGEAVTSNVALEGDWLKGLSPLLKKKRVFNEGNIYSGNRAGSAWYHNPDNPKQTKMIKDDETIPHGWMKGRPKIT